MHPGAFNMTQTNGSGPHIPAAKMPTGRPFASGPDPRRNGGGRPKGLARLAREAVGDGQDLIQFFAAVLRGDRKFLKERRIALRDRMAGGVWLADRAFGKAVQVVEIPEDPKEEQIQVMRQQIVEMPPALREQLGRWLLERRNARLRAERETIEGRVKNMLPSAEPLNPEENSVR
jgi:hypothetical protein